MENPAAPGLRPLDRWQALLADYATSGVTVHDHAIAVLRPRLSIPSGADPVVPATSAQLTSLPNGCSVAVAGMVIARQRPGTAKGTMFLLFEDEWGAMNLIVPGAVYERHRALARAEPLLLARGRLERSRDVRGTCWEKECEEGALPVVNVIVRELVALERFLATVGEGLAQVTRLPGAGGVAEAVEKQGGAEMAANMRAVAPPVQSFASGRRR
jgi:error-prone DNA polymerase